MTNGLIVHPNDDVVVVIEPISPGETVCYTVEGKEKQVVAQEAIPIYHKIAIHPIRSGEIVKKYNMPIGRATSDIGSGDAPALSQYYRIGGRNSMTFLGYPRPDGRVGVRNHVLILPASVCASDTTRIIASQVEGAITFNNQLGCSQAKKDMQYTLDVLAGYAANPNIYGTIVVALGCECCQCDIVCDAIRERTNKPLHGLIIQKEGGTIRTAEKAVRLARAMVAEAGMLQRVETPLSELILGTECGGSDPTSGIAANPVVGELSDLLVAEGATSILSETPEFIGAEKALAERAATKELHDRVLEIVRRYEEHFIVNGEDLRSGNPSPGNKAGGISTLEEKSLGCIHKGGTTTINAVYDYAKQIAKEDRGLVIMDTPGNDPSSLAGMIAGGAQICVFTSGLGTPTGNPVAPVIKITGNRGTFQMMEDNIDFDASPVVFGEKSVAQLGKDLLKMVVECANGKPSKAESLGFVETAIQRACNFT